MQQPVWVTVKLFIVYIVYTQWVNRQSSEPRFATAYNIRSDAKWQLSLTKEIWEWQVFLFSILRSAFHSWDVPCICLQKQVCRSISRTCNISQTKPTDSRFKQLRAHPSYPLRHDPEQAEFCRPMHILSVLSNQTGPGTSRVLPNDAHSICCLGRKRIGVYCLSQEGVDREEVVSSGKTWVQFQNMHSRSAHRSCT